MIDTNTVIQAVSDIIYCIEGSIPPRMKDTPARVAKSYQEVYDGYSVDIPSLFTSFDGEGKDQLIVARNIHTFSVCEHHLLPIELKVSVAYLPSTKVVGVSKIARLVHAFAHRLQLQERMTEQIASAVLTHLEPLGVCVVARGSHLCMRMRGVRAEDSEIITSVVLGEFRGDMSLRSEVMSLLRM